MTIQVINSRAAGDSIRRPRPPAGPFLWTTSAKPGMLYGALLQSPLAHATNSQHRHLRRAERLPGVKCVVTAKEAGLMPYGVSPARYDETLFCHDKVRYVGDEIAAVAAVDLETAQKAVESDQGGIRRTAGGVHHRGCHGRRRPPDCTKTTPATSAAEVHQEFGDVDAAFKTCDVIKTTTVKNKRQDGGFIEPQGCLAEFRHTRAT